MFENTESFSGFSVEDNGEARRFYGETLGLKMSEENEPMSMLTPHVAGDRKILVYAKPYHAPATFTILNFPVDDIDRAVDGLIERGVCFENYDDSNEKGIYRGGGAPIAWFRDPAGNVLSVIQLD